MKKWVSPPGKELDLMRFLVREKETENEEQTTGNQVMRHKNDFSIVNIFLFYFIKNKFVETIRLKSEHRMGWKQGNWERLEEKN